MSCKKPNFKIEHNSESINSALFGEYSNINDLIHNIKTGLKELSSFSTSIDESESLNNYIDSIDSLIETIIKKLENKDEELSESDILTLRNELSNFLNPSSAIINTEPVNATIPAVLMISEEELKSLEYSTILDEFFLNNAVVRQDRSERISRELFLLTIIDVKSKKVVSGNQELNENLLKFKAQEYAKLRKFLRDHNLTTDTIPASLYKSNSVQSTYTKALTDFYNYVYKEILNNRWENLLFNSWVNSLTGENELLEALNAYITLSHFDETIEDALGSYISINETLREPITEYKEDGLIKIKYKYKFNLGNASAVQGWETNGNRDAIKEMGKYSKLLIEGIPLLNYNSKGSPLRLNLNAVRFSNAVTKLFDALNKVKDTKIKDYAYECHDNILLFFPKVLQELFKHDNITLMSDLKRHGLNDFDINVLYSIHKQLYHGSHSYKAIENEHIRKNGLLTYRYPIVATILGVIDSTAIMNYWQTRYNSDTELYEPSIKIKYNADKFVYDMEEHINRSTVDNEFKDQILSKYQIKQEGTLYTITIDGKVYKINVPETILGGILAKLYSSERVKKFTTTGLVNFIEFDPASLINSDNEIKAIESLTESEKEFFNILLFIDTMLYTNFSKDVNDLQKLAVFKQLDENGLKSLFIAASRALVITQIHKKFDDSKFNILEFSKFLNSTEGDGVFKHTDLSKLHNRKGIIQRSQRGDLLITVSAAEDWIRNLSQADAILSGETSKAVIKNAEGSSIPNFSPAFEGAFIHRRLNQINKQEKITASSYLLFTNNSEAILDVVIDSDVTTENNDKKLIKSMSKGELLYNSIVHKYFLPQLGSTKSVVILATTYSDKTKFINYRLKQQLTKDINLATASPEALEKAIFDTIGSAYKAVWESVLNDYAQIFGTRNISEISKHLKELSIEAKREKVDPEQKLNALAVEKGVTIYRDTHFRKINTSTAEYKKISVLQINELLYDYANHLYASRESLHNRLYKEKIKFVESLIRNRVLFKLSLKANENTLDNTKNDLTTILTDRLGEKANNWRIHDRMIIAKIKDGNGKLVKDIIYGTFIQLKPGEVLEVNPILENYFYAHNLCSNNLRFSLTASEINHKVKALGKLNLAKTYLSKYTNFLETYEITDLNTASLVDIKEALELAKSDNDILYLPTEEITYVGDDIIKTSPEEVVNNKQTIEAHFQAIANIENIVNNKLYELEALAQGAQLKRNVIIPATLRYYQQGTLLGIISYAKVAIFDDIRAKVFNFDGKSDEIDAHDGAALMDPFTSRLENLSLQDNEVGTVKKPIWHHYDSEHMTAFLAKYAVDTITNQWMRLAELSNISLRNLFKKMTNLQWTEDIDLIEGCEFKKYDCAIDFSKDILEGSRLFYSKGYDNFEIIKLERDENGDYYTVEQQVTVDGSPIGNDKNLIKVYHYFDKYGNHYHSKDEGRHTINSLFELHTALGGIYSKSLTDNGLQYSEASVYAVTNYMNNVAILKEGGDENDLTQNSYRQPLKEYVISYAANNSAIKNGAGNVNPTSSFYDDADLMYITVSTEGHGVQMDSDHEADEAEMTEFSQVISSLDAGGRMHNYVKAVYKVLGQVALELAELEMDALDIFKTSGDLNVLYDVIGRTIINNLASREGKAGLTEAILKQIKKNFDLNSDHALDKFKIPFSDANIYSNILSTFVSIINRKSIKRKYPGLGTVLVPGYDISQIFDINGTIYLFEDLIKIANKELSEEELSKSEDISTYNRENVTTWLQKKHNDININPIYNDVNSIKPTEIIEILKNGEVIRDQDGKAFSPNLDDIEEYYKFIENPAVYLLQHGITIASNETLLFRKKLYAPRNLAPSLINFTYIDGANNERHISIFNIWALKEAFLKKDKSKRAKQDDVLRVLDGLVRNVFIDRITLANGEYQYVEYDIKPGTLSNTPAEIIMSNIYRSKFKVKEGLSLLDVRQNLDLFNEVPQVSESNFYDLAYTKNNGDHLYITFNKNNPEEGLDFTYKKWQYINRKPAYDNDKVTDRVYATDRDNIRLFEIGRDLIRTDIIYDSEIHKFREFDVKTKTPGNIVKNQKAFRRLGDKVVEYVEFVHRYEVIEDGFKRTLYNINKNNIKRVFASKNNDPETLDIKVNQFISKLLSKLYKASDYNGVKLATTLNRNTAILLERTLKGFGNELAYDKNLKDLVFNLHGLLEGTDSKEEHKGDFKISSRKQNRIIKDYFITLESKIRSSFEIALYFTASRIPAQTLQSFMQMKCVGFTGTSTNLCFVSHWQTWLQGSDYDIDKAYIMGHSFDNNGVYIGWSNQFDYSSVEALKASEQLPMPDKTQYLLSTDGVNISSYEQQYIIADNVGKIKILTELLNFLEANNITKINSTKDSILYQALKSHLATELPKSLKLEAFKNYISSHILTIVLDYRNMIGAYSPIEMSMLSDASDQLSKKGAASKGMTLYNPAVIYEMQYQNMTGKNVIGIAATGEKASFMWHHWMQDIIKNPELFKKYGFTHTSNRIQNRTKIEIVDGKKVIVETGEPTAVSINCLPDINFGNVTPSTIYKLTGDITVDLLISLVLSAATDNAKELILDKINSGNKLAKCYLYLITLGYNINDIVSFMTSSTLSFIDTFTEGNIFNDLNISEKEAIELAKGDIPESLYYKFFEAKAPSPSFSKKNPDYKLALKNREIILKIDTTDLSFKLVKMQLAFIDFIEEVRAHRPEEVNLDDVVEFENVLKGANEFSNFGRLLGLNQGLPTSKIDLNVLMQKIKNIVSQRELDLGLIDQKGNITETIPEYLLEYKDIIGKFEPEKYITDSNYRNRIIEYLNSIKMNIPIFRIIEDIPQFKSIMNLLEGVVIIDSNLSIKSKLFNKIYNDLKDKKYYIDEYIQKGILSFIDGLMIVDYFKHNRTVLPIEKGTKTLNDHNKLIDYEDKVELSTPTGINSFKYVFENVLIPQLKEGIYYDGTELVCDSQIATNPFIQGLIRTTNKKTPLYKVNLDMLAANASVNNRTKFLNYIKGLKELLSYKIGNLSISDWFMIYNLIVNKNNYGSDRMTTLLQGFVSDYNIKTSFIDRYLKHIGNIDKEKKVEDFPYNLTDILIATARSVNSEKNQKVPMLLVNTDSGPVYRIKIEGRFGYRDFKTPIEKISGESKILYLERLYNHFNYDTLHMDNFAFTDIIIKELANLDENALKIFNSMIIKGAVKINDICK